MYFILWNSALCVEDWVHIHTEIYAHICTFAGVHIILTWIIWLSPGMQDYLHGDPGATAASALFAGPDHS